MHGLGAGGRGGTVPTVVATGLEAVQVPQDAAVLQNASVCPLTEMADHPSSGSGTR